MKKRNKSVRIAHQSGGNCVARALSTMRLALGYKKAVPRNVPQGPQATHDIVRNLDNWFPDHEILVWCDYSLVKGNHRYEHQGECFTLSTNLDDYIVAFEYHCDDGSPIDENAEGHMVVGSPVFFKGMDTTFIVAVK